MSPGGLRAGGTGHSAGPGLTGCSGRVRSLLRAIPVKPDSSVAHCGTSVGSRWSTDVPCVPKPGMTWIHLSCCVWGEAGGLQHSQILLRSDLAPGTLISQNP